MCEMELRLTLFAWVALSALMCHLGCNSEVVEEVEVVDEVDRVEEVAADMRAARRVMLQQLCPCHPLPHLREIKRQRMRWVRRLRTSSARASTTTSTRSIMMTLMASGPTRRAKSSNAWTQTAFTEVGMKIVDQQRALLKER